MGILTGAWEDCLVLREHLNFDLCIIQNNMPVFVLENKMKSLPGQKQLDEYYNKSVKSKGAQRLLLCIKPFEDKNQNWRVVTYKEYAYSLEGCAKSLNISDKYIDDYVHFIQDLTDLIALWTSSLNDNTLVEEILSTNQASFYSEAKALRIHDLYSKLMYALIREKIQAKNPDIEVDEVGFFRGTPTLTLRVVRERSHSLKGHQLQVQAQQKGDVFITEYKYMDICGETNNQEDKTSSTEISTAKLLGAISFPNVQFSQPKGKDYYRYQLSKEEEHRYLKKTLPIGTTVAELVERLINDYIRLKEFNFLEYYKGEEQCPYSYDMDDVFYEWAREKEFYKRMTRENYNERQAYLQIGQNMPSLFAELGFPLEIVKEVEALSDIEKAWFADYNGHYFEAYPLYFREKHEITIHY